ncbi:hypothetical protein CTI12_AA171510 [Artemisia annua]|uniref:Uncharacterized protein n=1 Tax=Artemisia annua TaxID=35608 RepID=A0A2U1PBF3_ARTAN|nr:hypothetical protein CTI12_AA171510 [Artemisia annua]
MGSFMPINETGRHWCVAPVLISFPAWSQFYGCEENMYDCRDWYVRLRDCFRDNITLHYSPTAMTPMTGLADLAIMANSTSLRQMMRVMFEQDNERVFKLVQETHTMCQELCDRIKQRAEVIKELENLTIIGLARESVKLLKEMQDADLAKTRGMMKLISQTQLRVLKKISFVVQLGKK